ncbi:hypothetical protein QBC32DRAFT_346210 [Pseudoneurospora amorphoporcata]|uniref:Uncharacterized protein n=1 Tax=Pseudoneurospora amorphoporcata TaxID=241081 RepID=A0AAN6SEZ8_9PEZI|nr:hypothetical protein QBC32DRAFT_346210 [Pseudoneurospora amorphoporcata]
MMMPGINEIHLTREEAKPELMDAKYDYWEFKSPPDIYYISDQSSPINPYAGTREAKKKAAEEAERCRQDKPASLRRLWCLVAGGGAILSRYRYVIHPSTMLLPKSQHGFHFPPNFMRLSSGDYRHVSGKQAATWRPSKTKLHYSNIPTTARRSIDIWAGNWRA